ncbi:MAG: UDP-N-acetylglucosamine 4,6-dehydratase (inverting) [Deltaproteobacteria bacterium]|nr:UDP-N-acetylglucosamine 4,6-dehydratase (inverting) [Deltaproteobacteria bacterium]MDH3382744.1 UDP-N-acetylglucosamine 4,6-dehydratase (inverting) [Deltaproteobacteria bacterium]
MDLKGKVVLITGGTGSFGRKCVERLLGHYHVKKVIVFSRDELKQVEMQQASSDPRLRFFLGDVRDKERLYRAFSEVDVVIHAAALKQVPAAEYNPFEVIKTNVLGAQNVIECAIDRGVQRVIALSTDKAANPINLYGATKLCSDKLFVAGNAYVGSHPTRFSAVRYGNVVGSRGSVIPLFLSRRRDGVLPITDVRMTRFWITIGKGVDFVLECFSRMQGGEIFVPKIPSMRMADLARAIGPACRLEPIGIRPGEKLHEVMVTEDDARSTLELEDCFVILPLFEWQELADWTNRGKRCPEGFRYGSDTNDRWLTEEELVQMVAGLDTPEAREFALERGISV